jgi:maleate isomerase
VIAYGFTSSAYVIGPAGEAAMIARLEERTRGIPVVAPSVATVEALALFGARRVALMTPPWFDEELTGLGRRFYEDAGLEVVMAEPCGLPSDQTAIRPDEQAAWALARVPDAAQALVIGGNGFRAVGAIQALEAALGWPVITANQVLLWAALRAAGADTRKVSGYGRLFSL